MKKRIFLASASPRRRQLLEDGGYNVILVKSSYEESNNFTMPPADLVMLQAREKAKAAILPEALDTECADDIGCSDEETALVIGADTVVVLGDLILGKPRDSKEAIRMLESLSGRSHSVLTGVAIRYGAMTDIFYAETVITFKSLTPTEITDYVSTGSSLDKAGAYGLQDIGKLWATAVTGSFTNVVGLPMEDIEKRIALLM